MLMETKKQIEQYTNDCVEDITSHSDQIYIISFFKSILVRSAKKVCLFYIFPISFLHTG